MYERGIHELADIKYRILHLLPFSSLLSISTFLIYSAFRLKCLLTTHDVLWNVLNSALYFIAELGLLCKSGIFGDGLRMRTRTDQRQFLGF